MWVHYWPRPVEYGCARTRLVRESSREAVEARFPGAAVEVEPVADGGEGFGGEAADAFFAVALVGHQVRLFEHLEVTGGGRGRYGERSAQGADYCFASSEAD
jgi:hypothetical protein